MSFFYKPDDGWTGDFIPFYWEGAYHLFYLKDYRNKSEYGEGTPWFHLSTRDNVHFVDHGEAIVRGKEDEQDLYIYTGCVFEKDGLFHIFYTGHNPHLRAAGQPEEAVMQATSEDLITWTKNPTPILFADPEKYEIHDWRDPFVFWNEEAGEYWMLLAARIKTGPHNRRGITALVSSPDLENWTIRDPFWMPDLYFTHECPDVFKMGDWWYLVYSTFTERNITHYRMSKSLAGPWVAPANDSFDGRAFYAAKTASDGQRRFAYGWNPTRTNEEDTGRWNWGGSLVIHEVVQQPDGSLTVQMPQERVDAFKQDVSLTITPQIGQWKTQGDEWSADVTSGFAWASVAEMPPTSMLEATIQFSQNTRGVGIILRADETLDHYYQLRLEPDRNRIVFDRSPRPGDEPPIMERPVQLSPDQPVHIRVIVEDSIILAYVNDEVALSTRGYEHQSGNYGLFVSEGSATFDKIEVRAR